MNKCLLYKIKDHFEEPFQIVLVVVELIVHTIPCLSKKNIDKTLTNCTIFTIVIKFIIFSCRHISIMYNRAKRSIPADAGVGPHKLRLTVGPVGPQAGGCFRGSQPQLLGR